MGSKPLSYSIITHHLEYLKSGIHFKLLHQPKDWWEFKTHIKFNNYFLIKNVSVKRTLIYKLDLSF